MADNEDFDALLNHLYGFAEAMLKKHGEFFPFAAQVGADGKVAGVGGYTGEEQPESQEVIELLRKGLQQAAARGEIRAAGICYDARITPEGGEKTDAVCAQLEHKDGRASVVYLPYKKGWLGRLKFGELFAVEGEKKIFQ